MTPQAPRQLALAAAAGLGLSLLSALPAGAHGIAGSGLVAGASHPLLGLDHLLLRGGSSLQAVAAREVFTESDYGRVSDHAGYLVEFEPR